MMMMKKKKMKIMMMMICLLTKCSWDFASYIDGWQVMVVILTLMLLYKWSWWCPCDNQTLLGWGWIGLYLGAMLWLHCCCRACVISLRWSANFVLQDRSAMTNLNLCRNMFRHHRANAMSTSMQRLSTTGCSRKVQFDLNIGHLATKCSLKISCQRSI